MPLGIVDAAYIFTKITKPIMGSLRLQGKRSSIYIDDLLNSHQTEVGCAQQEVYIHHQFFKGGWVFKPEKSSGPPSQIVQYLGIIINSKTMNFEIPEVKFEFIITEAEFFLTTKYFPVRQLASWVGKLQSLRLAIGPIVSIMCKPLYFLISSAFSWSSSIRFDKNSAVEVTWWRDNFIPSSLTTQL